MLQDNVYLIFSLLSSHKPHEIYGNVSRMFMLAAVSVPNEEETMSN